jgi:hypothetical protein
VLGIVGLLVVLIIIGAAAGNKSNRTATTEPSPTGLSQADLYARYAEVVNADKAPVI